MSNDKSGHDVVESVSTTEFDKNNPNDIAALRNAMVRPAAKSVSPTEKCPTCSSELRTMHGCSNPIHGKSVHAIIRFECVRCADAWHQTCPTCGKHNLQCWCFAESRDSLCQVISQQSKSVSPQPTEPMGVILKELTQLRLKIGIAYPHLTWFEIEDLILRGAKQL